MFDISPGRKVARRIEWLRGGQRGGLDVTDNDLVLTTIGSPVESTAWGDHHTPAVFDPEIREGSIWALWRNIAAQDPAFGLPKVLHPHRPEQLCLGMPGTLDNKVPPYIQEICQRDPFLFDGNIVTGGLVSIRDSNWLLSWNVEREPHFPDQPHDMLLCHFYGAYSDRPGNYVKKAMRDCTGEEIAQEWLYHLGVPLDQIAELAANSVDSKPCMMPYITAFFLPRSGGDRPDVVPQGAVNFGFLGQFAETRGTPSSPSSTPSAPRWRRSIPCSASSGACRSRGAPVRRSRPARLGRGAGGRREGPAARPDRQAAGADRHRRAAAAVRADRRTRRPRPPHRRGAQNASPGHVGPLDD